MECGLAILVAVFIVGYLIDCKRNKDRGYWQR